MIRDAVQPVAGVTRVVAAAGCWLGSLWCSSTRWNDTDGDRVRLFLDSAGVAVRMDAQRPLRRLANWSTTPVFRSPQIRAARQQHAGSD